VLQGCRCGPLLVDIGLAFRSSTSRDLDVLQRYYDTHENRVPSLVEGLRNLNTELTLALDRHHTIGHTFFMAPVMTTGALLNVWRVDGGRVRRGRLGHWAARSSPITPIKKVRGAA
jgi:hypothetical protein